MKKLLLACMMALGIGANAQWTENFDSDTTIPAGWVVNNGGDPNTWSVSALGSGTAQSGANVMRIDYGATAHNDYLVTKAIPVVAGVSDRLSFYVKSYSSSYLENYKVMLSTTDQTSAAFTVTLQAQQKAPYAWTKLTYNLSAYAGQTVYVAVVATDTDQYRLYADTFVNDGMPTCVEPTALSTSGTTSTTATIGWTAPASAPAGGYDVYYSTTNTAPTATTTPSMNVSGITATLTGLTANTTYYVWVRSHCSATDQSVWISTTAFTGYCQPTAGASSTSYYLKTIGITNAISNYSYTASAYSALVNDTANSFSSYAGQVVNYAMANSTTATCYFYIWVDWNDDLDFNDAGETMVATTSYEVSTSGTMTIPATAPIGSHRVRYGISESGTITACGPAPYGNYVDSTVNIVAPPSCVSPTAVTTNTTGTNTATVSWTAPATAPTGGYDVYYSTTNTAPTATTTPNQTGVTGTTATLSGLSSATTYYVWVRSHCSATDQSTWVTGPSFLTFCDAAATINENFDTTSSTGYILPTCWSKIMTGFANAYVQANTVMSAPNNLYFYSSSSTDTSIVKLPPLSTLSTGNYTLQFNGRANFTVGGVVQVGYMTNPLDATTFVVLGTYTSTSLTTIDTFTLPITGVPAGVTTLALKHTGVPSNSVLIDNLKYDLTSVILGTSEVAAAKASEKVYPNPFTDFVDISDVKGAVSAMVVDASGKMVASFAKADSRLDLSKLNAGLYILSVTKKDGSVSTFKIIKK